ncbi:MAG: hypothetical protein V1811_00195 [Candidatus Micrarchaeota archaeon]
MARPKPKIEVTASMDGGKVRHTQEVTGGIVETELTVNQKKEVNMTVGYDHSSGHSVKFKIPVGLLVKLAYGKIAAAMARRRAAAAARRR